MNGSLYIGATGMKSLAEGMNVVSNNIANANTLGFKQQSMLFSELMSQGQANMGGWWGAQEGSYVALGQVGMGVQVDSVRTMFSQGGYEMGSDVTDLSISGKGFFEVTNQDGNKLYTRAGNFRFNQEGFLNLPGGETLTGYKINADGTKGAAGPIQVDLFSISQPKATSQINLGVNLGSAEDKSQSATDPFFSMVQAYDATKSPPLSSSAYNYSQSVRVYDANGKPQDLTIYFDGTPEQTPGKTMEFMVAKTASGPGETSEMLMSGTMTFNGQGQLADMSAFVPTGGDPKDLTSWVPSPLANGSPQFTFNGQPITLDLGLKAQGGWTNAPANAAAVGTDKTKLASMGTTATRHAEASTGYPGSSSQITNVQDGYGEGTLTSMDIKADGRVVGTYSNGEVIDLYEIPVCRFTSEDGLRREGGNFFSMTDEAGAMEMGMAGTENYGKIMAKSLETSNVDMAREMVNMISTQRGFQANSKVVTTADALLQKALELKR